MESYRDKDILSGRGGKVNRHSGNKIYRRLIDDKRGLYRSYLRTDQKSLLVHSILMALQQEGMRFLRFDEESKLWYEIDHNEAFMKTSQAFREPGSRKWLSSVAAAEAAASSSEAASSQFHTPQAGGRAESAVQDDVPDEEQSSAKTVERGPMTAPKDAAAVHDAVLPGTFVPRGYAAYSPRLPSRHPPAGGDHGTTLLRQSAFAAPATNASYSPRPTPVHSKDIHNSLLTPAQEGLLLLNSNLQRNQHQPQAPSRVTPSTVDISLLPRRNTSDIMHFMTAIAPKEQVIAPGVEHRPFLRAISGGEVPPNITATPQLSLQPSGLPFFAFLPSISIDVSPDHPAWPSLSLGNTLHSTSIRGDWNGFGPFTSLGHSLALDSNLSISLAPLSRASISSTDGRSRIEHADLHSFHSQRQAHQHWMYGSFCGNGALAEALA